MQKLMGLLTLSTIIQLATTLQCLNHKCQDNQWCHLYREEEDEGIKSQCTNHKPNNGITCVGSDTVKTTHGCYCNTVECVHNTALHALGTACHSNQEIEIYKQSETYLARCRSHGHSTQDCGIFEVIDLPNNDISFLPCTCKTQYCANTMMDRVHEALMTTGAPTTTTAAPTTTTATQAPTTTIQIQPGMVCGDQTCDIHNIYCHLFQYRDVPTSRCMPFNVWQPCNTYTDVFHQGCTCTTTLCVSNMLTDFAAYITPSEGTSPTTSIVQTTTTSTTTAQTTTQSSTVAQTIPKPTTIGQPITQSTTTKPSTTQSTTTVTSTTDSLAVSSVVPDTTTTTTHAPVTPTMSTTTATTWKCLTVFCQLNEACRLSFGFGGIKAVCESGVSGITADCVDHQSITKDGCLCRSEICVAKTALHCFGNNCPADKTCKISRVVDGSFTGNCSDLDFSHLSFCSKTPANQQVQCDCWTQSCIDPYPIV